MVTHLQEMRRYEDLDGEDLHVAVGRLCPQSELCFHDFWLISGCPVGRWLPHCPGNRGVDGVDSGLSHTSAGRGSLGVEQSLPQLDAGSVLIGVIYYAVISEAQHCSDISYLGR